MKQHRRIVGIFAVLTFLAILGASMVAAGGFGKFVGQHRQRRRAGWHRQRCGRLPEQRARHRQLRLHLVGLVGRLRDRLRRHGRRQRRLRPRRPRPGRQRRHAQAFDASAGTTTVNLTPPKDVGSFSQVDILLTP